MITKFQNYYETTLVKELSSGKFYWVHTESECYRVQEVDQFRKSKIDNWVGFLDKQGILNHFNRSQSSTSAQTLLVDLFKLDNLKKIEFSEFTPQALKEISENPSLDSADSDELIVLSRTVKAFKGLAASEQGKIYSIDQLRSEYMKDYILSPELH